MDSRLTWKSILIVAVLLLFGLSLYPPNETLNLGLDLRGGTSLLYEVDTAGAEDPQETLLRTIDVLQDRVDPQGVRNLNWRVEAGNRIEIQMPLAPQHVVERRRAFQEQLEQIEESSIRRSEVQAAMRLEDEGARQEELQRLTHGVEGRFEALQDAAAAYDELQAARQPLEGVEPGSDEHIDLSGDVAAAEIQFEQALEDVDATDLDPGEIGRVLEMPDAPEREGGEPIEGSSPRARALEQLKAEHPARAEQIDRAVAAYEAYQQVKGPLDDPNDLIRLLRGAGVLEFRVAVSPEEAGDVEEMRAQLQERGPRAVAVDAPQRWYVLDDPAEFADSPEALEAMREDPAAYFLQRGMVGAAYGGDFYLLLWNEPGRSITEDRPGWELSQATPGVDRLGRPAVDFQLNETGGQLMQQMTRNNVDRPMAIVLDDRIYTAPNINEPLRNRVQISSGRGGFSDAELDYLIRTLSAGSLKARLSEDPISVRSVGPSLGQDNLERGLKSAVGALIAVAIFMMIYYFVAGAVADLALVANIVIILGVMAALQAVFTLPGIAGIVLTIGLAVDANVLIFERIREELRRGADMLTSLRLGYEKAFSAIIDGNITNLIICFVLGYTATAEVKGFAVTLGIGIIATLFTSLFMTRVIFDLYYRVFGAKKMSMLPSAVPAVERALSPNIDWIGKRSIFFTLSAVMLVGSVVLVSVRGEEMLDIEFRAGTEVTFDLTEGERIPLQEARDRLEGADLGNYNVVSVGGRQDGGAESFSIVTTVTDPSAVAETVRDAFGDLLDVQPVVEFADSEAEGLSEAPADPVTQTNLGEVINRPAVEDEVSDYLGGVAIVLDGLDPPQTIAALEDRIRSMRFQPDFESVQFRDFEVIGLDPDPQRPGRFRSAAVVSFDPTVNYFDNPDAWESVLAESEWRVVSEALSRETSLSKISNFNPAVARSMTHQAIVALLLSLTAIVVYIWFRFGSLRFGLAAVAALVHDLTITLGLIALSAYLYDNVLGQALLLDPFQINMGLIAALLTIVGYSLNDTIVLFDRIRENRGKLAVASPTIINESINQVISRTALTSFTTFMAVMFMYVIGGAGIHAFAFALVIGVIIGTYSSLVIASPLLLLGTKYAGRPSPAPEKSPRDDRSKVRA